MSDKDFLKYQNLKWKKKLLFFQDGGLDSSAEILDIIHDISTNNFANLCQKNDYKLVQNNYKLVKNDYKLVKNDYKLVKMIIS